MKYVVRSFARSFALCIFSFFFIIAFASAQEEQQQSYIPLDFDGDGQSDFALFENQADGSPNELVHEIQLSGGEDDISQEYGKSTDHVAYGDYDGDGIWEIVFVRDNGESLDWYTARENTPGVTFGLTEDIILSGCDFDGDSTSDRAVIRQGVLIVSRSSDQEESSTTLELGSSMSISSALCFDIDNDDAAEFLFLGSRLKSDSGETRGIEKCKQVYETRKERKACRKRNKAIRGNAHNNSREEILLVLESDGTFQSKHRAKRATSPVVADLDNDGTYEVGFFKARKRAGQLHFYIADGATFRKQKIVLPVGTTHAAQIKRTADDITRDFLLLRNNDESFGLFDLDSLSLGSVNEVTISGDSLIQPVNINYTGSSVPEDPEGVCESVEDFSDGANGRVWKSSDHGGTAVFVRPVCDGTSKRVYVMKDGVIHGEMYYTGLANPDACGLREHWRHSKRTSEFPPRSIIVVKMRSGETKCYQLNDTPGRRND